MTVYNDRRFVREAVDSLLRQDFEDFELIIVDDCCDDPDFVAGLAALDSRIRVLRNVQNVGTAVSANRGIDAARAAIIARLDSDDVAEPARIGRLVEALRADPELGLVGSAVTYIDEGGRNRGVQSMPESDFEIRFTLMFHNPFYHSAVAFRRDCFEAAGRYRNDEPISQDHYLWFDMLPHVRARNLAEPLTRYRLNSQGLTASNGHNPRQRTHAIREALWSEVGLAYEAGADGPAKDISALLKHQELHDQARRDAAGRTIDMVLSRLIARRDTFMRDTERAEIDNMVASLRARLAKRAPRTPAGFARLWRLARTMGPRATLHLAFDRLTRRLRAHPRTVPARLGRVRPVDSLMALFHDVSPYEGLDLVAHPDDLQGWGSNDPLLGAVIRALRPAIIVEVGSWKGASAIHMARAARALGLDTRIVCVDTWLGSAEHVLGERPEWREALRPLHGYPQLYFTFLANVARAGLADRIIPLPNSSDNAALVLRAKGVRPELVYVDGAHEEEAVYRDLRAYWDLLAPGGALVGDDYLAWDGVTRAARRFAAEVGSPILGRKGKFLLWKGDPPRSFAGIPD